jgi:hypothetical protein
VKSAAGRDFVAEYVKAVRKAGLRVGLYYSPLDWRFPGYTMPDLQRESAEAMRDQYHRQVKELLSNYGKLDVLWFDVLNWPMEKLRLPAIPAKVVSASALAGGDVSFVQNENGIEISAPAATRNEVDSVIVLHLDSLASMIQPVK